MAGRGNPQVLDCFTAFAMTLVCHCEAFKAVAIHVPWFLDLFGYNSHVVLDQTFAVGGVL